jgi:hypothetical protein
MHQHQQKFHEHQGGKSIFEPHIIFLFSHSVLLLYRSICDRQEKDVCIKDWEKESLCLPQAASCKISDAVANFFLN